MNRPDRPNQPLLTWAAHPARERPWATVAAIAAILALGAAAGLFAGHWLWAVLAAALLAASLNRFFLLSRFSIDGDGITARFPLKRQRLLWRDVRRFVQDERGGHLSTRAVPTRLDAFTGMHILFGQHRAAVTGQIRDCIRVSSPLKTSPAVKELAA
jgi:Zn-dependent protease